TSGQEGIYRQWSSATRPYDQFARLTFDVRLDSSSTVFDTISDNLSICARSSAIVGTGNDCSFFIRAFGAANGALGAREWGVFNGDPGVANAYDATLFRPSGMTCQPGVTYTFTVDLYAATAAGTTAGKTHGTYDVTISDGTSTVQVLGSGFRSAAYTSGGYLSFSTQQNVSTDNLTFSLDNIGMTNLNATTTSLVSNNNPASVGELVTVSATVVGSDSTPTGVVTFMDGTTPLGTGSLDASGVATLATSSLAAGAHSLTANYAASATSLASTSSSIQQNIRYDTSVDLASSDNPADTGAAVTLMATVTADAGIPTGNVTFYNNATSLGTGTLNASGVATLTTSVLAAGPHSITAIYPTSSIYAGSVSPAVDQTIRYATTTALSTSANPASPASSVTFTATVSGGASTPLGTVTFLDGVDAIGTEILDGLGVATFTTASLSPGAHSITASYAASTSHSSSVSPALAQTIRDATSTIVVSSANPTVTGNSILFTATVSSTGGIPTGSVTFLDGATVIGTSDLNSTGEGSFVTSALSVGSHSITASYAYTASYTASTSAVLTQTITASTTDMYHDWAAGYPSLTDTAPTSNPDGDSSNNLQEYAFGTDPTVGSSTSISYTNGVVTAHGQPTTSITNIANSVNYRAVFGRRKDYVVAGLNYTVQFSADLDVWINSTDSPADIASDAIIDAVSVPYPLFIQTSRGDVKPTYFRVGVSSK
ncbi:MAG: Ig-like domain-containing protein, partial [Luteolibacter sp.]